MRMAGWTTTLVSPEERMLQEAQQRLCNDKQENYHRAENGVRIIEKL
jgi:hypothetical protein